MKKILLLLALVFLFSAKGYSQYFTEDFESAFVGSPAAPPGWSVTQTKVVPYPANEKEWAQNVWSGSAWSITSTGNTNTIGPKSGTGVLWIDDYNFFGSATPNQSRRMESPTINLGSSTSPFVRFWYFNSQNPGQNSTVRISMSSDGGTTWNEVAPILNGWDSIASKWNRINVKVPAAYRVANFKFAFEITNRWGTANPFIDLLSVEEFTPTTITSTATGNWNATTTWVGGIPPTSDNNVIIAAGHTVTIPAVTGLVGRCQNLQVDGILTFGTTTTTAFCAFQDISVTATGRINAFNGTSGRTVWCGGNFSNAGALNFAVPNTTAANWATTGAPTGASTLVMFGAGGTSYTNTGTLDSNRINNLWIISAGTVTINSPLTVPLTLGLYNGNLVHGGNLTLGNAGAFGQVQTIERHRGTLASDPTWNNTRIASRSNTYNTTNLASISPFALYPGSEVELVSGVRTTTGTLLMNTFNNVILNYPMTVGTTTTGAMTLTKGIIITNATNILKVASFVAPPTGVAPTTVLPGTGVVQGAYVYGPISIDFPATTASRNVPIGYGANGNVSVPSQNKLLSFSLATLTAWTTGTSVTITPVGKPSGSAIAPITAVMGTRAYQISLNPGSPDLSVDAYISGLKGNNYTYGDGSGSDSLLGSQQNLFIAQSTALTGPWTVRSITSGTGAFTNNTDYTRNTATGAPGPISPIGTNGGYFCWATNGTANDITAFSVAPSGSAFYSNASTPISMSGSVKNTGLSTTSGLIYITRKVIGTAYSSSTTVAAGLAPNATANTTFADFTGWTAGVSYQIKDSVYYAGDAAASNDTLSAFFTPNVAKPILIYYGTDTRSRDSIVTHMAGLGLSTQYDLVASFSTGIPLSLWRTIIFLSPSGYNFTANTATRDSLKLWLDGSTPSAKRTLLLFGNDIGYYLDPRRNAGATAADTTFYRQYLHAAYLADDWVDAFTASDSTLKGGVSPWTTITGQRINDPYPDCVQPAIWNSTGGTPYGALFPVTESGDGDSCAAVGYLGTNYNMFYMANVYYGIVPTVSGALSPQGVVLNVIKNFTETSEGVFPVELASFTSSVDRRGVILKWTTNNEENNAGFDIERKTAGTNEWVKVANVTGAGNSNTVRNYTYSDNNLATGRYNYRLKQMDFNGNYKYYDLTGEVIIGVPVKFDISQNYPNPFNPSTKINFDLPFDSKVQIKVFDITGREIYQMLNETKTAGYYTVQFNASALASGVYFYQINATGGNQSYIKTMKMVLVK